MLNIVITMVREKTHTSQREDEKTSEIREIILFNDDVNTFDFVIETLILICEHDQHQAEQCTLIVHLKGKCSVKKGSYSELESSYKEMLDRGLTVSIK